MVRKKRFIKIDLSDVSKFGNDAALLVWYSALKAYAEAFEKDKLGFTRVSPGTIQQDFGYNHVRVWRYNKKLEDKGLIIVDKRNRGGRTWMGYRLI